MSNHDAVNHPSHYTTGKVEVIEYIEDKLTLEQLEGYFVGNIIKYTSRYKHKGGVEDLKKAAWYLDRLISKLDATDTNVGSKEHRQAPAPGLKQNNLCQLRKTECYNKQCKRTVQDHYFNQCWSNKFVHYVGKVEEKVDKSCETCRIGSNRLLESTGQWKCGHMTTEEAEECRNNNYRSWFKKEAK